MKKKLIFFVMTMALLLTGCGGEKGGSISGEMVIPTKADELVTAQLQCVEVQSDTSMLAFCDTREPNLHTGDYVLLLEDAKLQDAEGQELTISDFAPGCYVSIQWSGEVMESEPGQIAVEVLTLEQQPTGADDSAETADGGEIGELEKPAADYYVDIPEMRVEYATDIAAVKVMIPCNGPYSWSWVDPATGEGQDMEASADAVNPIGWEPDESHVIHAEGVETMTLYGVPECSAITVRACDRLGETEVWTDVTLEADSSFQPLQGEYVYWIHAQWDGAENNGSGDYWVLITA